MGYCFHVALESCHGGWEHACGLRALRGWMGACLRLKIFVESFCLMKKGVSKCKRTCIKAEKANNHTKHDKQQQQQIKNKQTRKTPPPTKKKRKKKKEKTSQEVIQHSSI